MNQYLGRKLAIVLLIISAIPLAAEELIADIPEGASVQVRIDENLSSETASVGQPFHGTLVAPITRNGRALFRKGAAVTGEVVQVERSGRLSNPGELDLSLRTIRSGARTYSVNLPSIVIKGESHAKSNVTKIGGTTAFGAIVGAMAGGGKGAAIGAGVGAAAGTGVAAATGKKPAEVQSEAVLVWAAQSFVEAAPPQQPEPQPEPQPATQPEPAPQPEAQMVYREDSAPRAEMSRDRYDDDDDHNAEYNRTVPEGFSRYERRIIGECFVDDRDGSQSGRGNGDRLPPGLDRRLQRDRILPAGLQRRVQPLPDQCTDRLPILPKYWSRVALGHRVILLDPRLRIVDLLWVRGD